MSDRKKDPLLEACIGDYHLTQKLGSGSLGTTYLARSREGGRRMVVKVMAEHVIKDTGTPERYLQRTRSIQHLKHPNVVELLDFDQLESGEFYLSMEHLEGEPFSMRMQRKKIRLAEMTTLLEQVCDVLTRGHSRKIIHRNLKPSNIYLATIGKEKLYKIMDYGVIKAPRPGKDGNSRSGSSDMPDPFFGTAVYLSPELARGEEARVGPHSDIYSLGVILYKILTDQFPVYGTTVEEVAAYHAVREAMPLRDYNPGVPESLAEVVMKCLDKDIEERFSSPMELFFEFQGACAGLPPDLSFDGTFVGSQAISISNTRSNPRIRREDLPGATPVTEGQKTMGTPTGTAHKAAAAVKSHAPAEKSHAPAEKSHAAAENSHAPAEKSHAVAEKSHAAAVKSHAPAEKSHAPAENSVVQAEYSAAQAEHSPGGGAKEKPTPAKAESARPEQHSSKLARASHKHPVPAAATKRPASPTSSVEEIPAVSSPPPPPPPVKVVPVVSSPPPPPPPPVKVVPVVSSLPPPPPAVDMELEVDFDAPAPAVPAEPVAKASSVLPVVQAPLATGLEAAPVVPGGALQKLRALPPRVQAVLGVFALIVVVSGAVLLRSLLSTDSSGNGSQAGPAADRPVPPEPAAQVTPPPKEATVPDRTNRYLIKSIPAGAALKVTRASGVVSTLRTPVELILDTGESCDLVFTLEGHQEVTRSLRQEGAPEKIKEILQELQPLPSTDASPETAEKPEDPETPEMASPAVEPVTPMDAPKKPPAMKPVVKRPPVKKPTPKTTPTKTTPKKGMKNAKKELGDDIL
ncbi:protein kinase [Myxococcota bacterium]|nr:protein kinase [Myxococcota bacterium]